MNACFSLCSLGNRPEMEICKQGFCQGLPSETMSVGDVGSRTGQRGKLNCGAVGRGSSVDSMRNCGVGKTLENCILPGKRFGTITECKLLLQTVWKTTPLCQWQCLERNSATTYSWPTLSAPGKA